MYVLELKNKVKSLQGVTADCESEASGAVTCTPTLCDDGSEVRAPN